MLDELQKLMHALEFIYIHQEEAKGLGHAISLARETIGNEFFGVLLPDDIMDSSKPGIKQLMDIAQERKCERDCCARNAQRNNLILRGYRI